MLRPTIAALLLPPSRLPARAPCEAKTGRAPPLRKDYFLRLTESQKARGDSIRALSWRSRTKRSLSPVMTASILPDAIRPKIIRSLGSRQASGGTSCGSRSCVLSRSNPTYSATTGGGALIFCFGDTGLPVSGRRIRADPFRCGRRGCGSGRRRAWGSCLRAAGPRARRASSRRRSPTR